MPLLYLAMAAGKNAFTRTCLRASNLPPLKGEVSRRQPRRRGSTEGLKSSASLFFFVVFAAAAHGCEGEDQKRGLPVDLM